jgi:hydroxymethylpyrimidine/phosphomethylpyrimidine kinase
LTIAGLDPSGGAGIAADLKTFHRFSVYGMSALTLVTVQNTVGVTRVEVLSPALARAQIEACVSDIGVDAMKTGALGSAEMIRMVADVARLVSAPLVVDPVMVSKHGARLLDEAALSAFHQALLPVAAILTPNVPEAECLLGVSIKTKADMEAAAHALLARGAQAVVMKGGHLDDRTADDFFLDDEHARWLEAPRVATKHTHGTGCTFSAAIAAGLANGRDRLEAAEEAKAFITRAIGSAPGLGSGHGPVDHWA